MEILLVLIGVIIWWFITYMYLDLKHIIKEETINWVEYNDKMYRILRTFIEKNNPQIITDFMEYRKKEKELERNKGN